MALKVELKPGERVILGGCLVTNEGPRTKLRIQGAAPILREKDIMTPETATSPARRIYLVVQAMYLSGDTASHHTEYFALVRDIISAAPSTTPLVENINNRILTGDLYKALREACSLIAYEQELVENAKGR